MELMIKAEIPTTFDLSAPSSPRRPLLPDPDSSDFEFSGHLLPNLTLPAADELFDGGVIRPLKPSPRPLPPLTNPKTKTKTKAEPALTTKTPGRGRAKETDSKPAAARNRNSRSVSPLRVSEFALHQSSTNSAKPPSCSSSSLSSSSSLKWRLKDLLLFRSASEGRAPTTTTKVVPALKRSSVSSALLRCVGSNYDDDSSFRYAIGDGEGSTSRRRSAHDLHYYRANDQAEAKKKNKMVSSYPYKQRLMDYMGLGSSSSTFRGFGQCLS